MVPRSLMVLMLSVICSSLVISQIRAEYIFRGKCTRLLQPQETAITIDPEDLVFNLYVIPPVTKQVNRMETCQSQCLATTNPPCRSAIYQALQKTCFLLRADKQTALEFDTRNYTATTISGILITPQTLTDYVTDRKGGVARCDNYCPAVGSQSPDTITPVCVKDCSSDAPVCAGEMSGCMDFARRVTVDQVSNITNWNISSSFAFPYLLRDTTITKKYDFTHLRITIQLGAWHIRPHTTCANCPIAGNIYAEINNDKVCTGEANSGHFLRRYMLEGYPGAMETAEPMNGEFSCTYYDSPAGSYPISLYYDYQTFPGEGFGYDGEAPAYNAGSGNIAPVMIHVEEYIPASYLMKIDDSARCQSATVFNSHSYQWTNLTLSSSGAWSGSTNWAVWKYKKRSDTSTLRIKWQGVVFADFWQGCLHLYFTINDQPCSDPTSIDTVIYGFNYGNSITNKSNPDGVTTSLDGICRGLPAGRYDLVMWMDNSCSALSNVTLINSFSLGHGTPSSMIVEEIHESLPINALLLSDGSMVRLPYYNRQYFTSNVGCSSMAPNNSCFNPVLTQTYTKLQDSSALHIKWYDTHYFCTKSLGSTAKEIIRFFVKINGAECNNPTIIETWWMDNNSPYGICKVRPKYVEGVCKTPIAAGPVTITTHIDQAVPSWGGTFVHGPHGHTMTLNSYLMVEEMYDGSL